jgi:hypothetical protein
MKVPVIVSADYTVYFEPYEQYNFIHCDCSKWSKQVKKQLIEDFDLLTSVYRKDIYAFHELGDNKHLKFINIFKFTYVKDIVGFDNITRQLFVRKYNGN